MTTEERLDQMEEVIVKMGGLLNLSPQPLVLPPEVQDYMRLDMANKLLDMTVRIMKRKGIPVPTKN